MRQTEIETEPPEGEGERGGKKSEKHKFETGIESEQERE